MTKEKCNTSNFDEAEYGCEGCDHYNTASGDCWKNAKYIRSGEAGFELWELESGKTVWV